MEHELVVLSPEKTILTYPLAGVGRRIGAHVVDVLVIIALISGILVLGSVTASIYLDVGALAAMVAIFLASSMPFLYFILLEGLWNGRTLGKLACGLRVRMADGTPIKFGAAVARNLVRVADFIPPPYFTGMVAIFTTPRSQRLGDLVAGTVVVMEKRAVPAFNPAPHKAGIHPYESEVGDLRGMSFEEYTALKRLCDRYYELSPPLQAKLMEEVWHPIAIRRNVRLGHDPSISLYLAEAAVMKYGRQHGLL